MTKYLALLRGINVGGNNLIKMTELKATFESMGFTNVSTYIQSGNVLFEAKQTDEDALTKSIENSLSKKFNYSARITLRSLQELKKIVEQAPTGFGSEPKKYRYNAIFLKKPLTAAEAMKSVTAREHVDEVHAGNGVLYFQNLMALASRSHLSKIVGTPIYKDITIRNWNTTTKLLNLLDDQTKA